MGGSLVGGSLSSAATFAGTYCKFDSGRAFGVSPKRSLRLAADCAVVLAETGYG